MAQGTITLRTQFIDTDGNIIGVDEHPLIIDSDRLIGAIETLTEEVIKLRTSIELANGFSTD